MLGRAVLYGLTAAGESGARAIIDMFKTDLVRTLTLLGCPSIKNLSREHLYEH